MAVIYSRIIDNLIHKNIVSKENCRDALLKIRSNAGRNGDKGSTGQKLLQVLI